MKYRGFTALNVAMILGTGLVSLPSQAETDQSQDQAARLMEELVVTARRREEGLQDAPLAVSAYTNETLDYRGVTRLDEIARFVPGLTLENNPSFGGASNSAANLSSRRWSEGIPANNGARRWPVC